MTFHEVHASQFTSPTTPYTSCRHADGFFATETHLLHCKSRDDNIQVTAGPLPPPHELCTGHDQSGAWQLFAFLDSSRVSDEQEVTNVSEAPVVDSTGQEDGATIAWLVVQSKEELAPVFTVSLTFRPLTPLLTTPVDSHSEEEESKVVAWVGSADDSKLRCFVASDGNRCELLQVQLKNDAFSFDSPIMIMDALTCGKQHYIAFGCQDGTVRIISFQYQHKGESLSFAKLAAHTILVDGPIMALHLSQQDNTIHLVVGSMCGFVCRMKKPGNNGCWEGPLMVAEGLWNEQLASEDPVLAVNMLPNDLVALGTHSGQCCVWQQRKGDAADSCRLVWKVQLPYSIHGLSNVNNASTGQPCLLVTTRFTFHVFQRDAPKYCAETAKKRVEKLISERQTAIELLKIV